MGEKSKKMDGSRVKKKSKKSDQGDGSKKPKSSKQEQTAASAFSLLADKKSVDSSLASLFAVKQPPVKAKPVPVQEKPTAAVDDEDDDDEEDNDAELSEIDEHVDGGESDADEPRPEDVLKEAAIGEDEESAPPKRKRKRKNADEELEDAYMSRLAREEEKDAERSAAERAAKRQKHLDGEEETEQNGVVRAVNEDGDGEAGEDDDDDDSAFEDEDEDAMSPPPKHETQIAVDDDLSKAGRTVFLANVSTTAISSKSARKTLLNHLASFFSKLPASKDDPKHKVESIRFRSTPYASAIPKKAAYAKKELMDATTKSTNAYAVYSTEKLAREACKHLNGTVVLDRHLRVDSVAHPAKVENRRCIFVGNLGFVDDESNIQDANEEDGREKRKRGKEPADIEEGLWRTFGKCGKVESVRVIRDSTTRVGKGIAYVQFEDENGVEAALQYNEKKFPPMLPRKLRVSRAKAPKKNAKPGTGRPSARPAAPTGYQRKITGEEASRMGRTSKLLGRAAAANMRKHDRSGEKPAREPRSALGDGMKKPEAFIFEGHRASSKSGKSGLKLGGKKKSKVTKRSSSFKSKKA